MTTSRVRTRLSPRDIRVLTWIGEVRGVRWDLLAWLLGLGSPKVGRGLGPVSRTAWQRWSYRMRDQGLLTVQSLMGQQWVYLSHGGAGHLGLPWARYGLRLSELDHYQAVGEVRFWLEGNWPQGAWVPEFRFRQAGSRRPDGGWQAPSEEGGKLAAVEVELHRKTRFREQYLDLVRAMPEEVEEVWWFAGTEADASWLAGKLDGAILPCRLAVVPYLSLPATHPLDCRCWPCRVRVAEQAEMPELFFRALPGEVPE